MTTGRVQDLSDIKQEINRKEEKLEFSPHVHCKTSSLHDFLSHYSVLDLKSNLNKGYANELHSLTDLKSECL